MTRTLRIGTRGSQLALVQARWVAARLAEHDVATELVTIRTEGDDRPVDTAWGEGAFVGRIVEALLDGSVDLAVHSAKDVPTDEAPGARHRRLSAPRGPARRARVPRARDDARDAARARARRNRQPAPGRVPAGRPAGPRHPCRSTATSTRGWPSWTAATPTPSCSPWRASRGSDAPTASTRSCPPRWSRRHPGRGASRSRSGPTTPRRSRRSRGSTTPRRAPRCRPSGRCSTGRAAAAARRSARSGRLDGDTLEARRRRGAVVGAAAGCARSQRRSRGSHGSGAARPLPTTGRWRRDWRAGSSRSASGRGCSTLRPDAQAGPLARRARGGRHRRRERPGDRDRARRRPARCSTSRCPQAQAGQRVVVTSANGADAVVAALGRLDLPAGRFALGRGRRGVADRARRGRRGRRVRPDGPGRRQPRGASCRSSRASPSSLARAELADPALPDDAPRAWRDGHRGRRVPHGRGARRRPSPASPRRSTTARSTPSSSPAARPPAACSRSRRTTRSAARLRATPVVASGRRPRPRHATRGSAPSRSPRRPTRESVAAFVAGALGAATRRARDVQRSRDEHHDRSPHGAGGPGRRRRSRRRADPDPAHRLRRTRRTEALRAFVRETRIHPRQLVAPLFVVPGLAAVASPSARCPASSASRPTRRVEDARRLEALGVGGVILFGLPAEKDAIGTGGWVADGIVQETLRRLRDADLGPRAHRRHVPVRVHRPRPLRPAARPTAGSTTTPRSSCSRDRRVARREAGADIVAPSRDDGRPGRRDPRRRWTPTGTQDTAILAYAAKTASRVLRPVPRRRGLRARVRRPARLPDGPGQRPRGAARDGRRRRRGRRHAAGQARAAVARHPRRGPRPVRPCRSAPTR